MKINLYIATAVLLMAFMVSCVPVEKLSYFNDIDDIEEPTVNPRTQKVILPFDRLYIKVISIDMPTNQIFNSTDEMRTASYGTSSGLLGYLVDEQGNVNFPFVGNINVASLTTAQAGEKIQKALSDYVANTSVIVKFVDNQITVMGEVNRQGVYPFIQDKLNIYEAIGLGGGLTRYGNRQNVIVVRHVNGKIMHYRLNLSDSKIASKDYYYILPNDVVIVEPLKDISTSYQNITYSTILASISAALAVLLFMGLGF
jgi:polysaccharide export outer membrane protein